MKIMLIHGLGRTTLSMTLLRHRLTKAGLNVSTFGYNAMLETFDHCLHRLIDRIRSIGETDSYILVGHSLGTVFIRAALPELSESLPAACFFIAPPSHAPRIAQRLASNRVYRILTGDMGQRTAQPDFIDSLPIPNVPTLIYAGTAGPKSRWFLFGEEENDGILSVSETRINEQIPVIRLPCLHTFIMNSRRIAADIIDTASDGGNDSQQYPE